MQTPLREVKLQDERPTPKTDAAGAPVRKRSVALNLSLVGLILSVFAGLGIFFSIAGTAAGACSKRDESSARTSAIAIGIGGIILSAIFIVLTVIILIGLMGSLGSV